MTRPAWLLPGVLAALVAASVPVASAMPKFRLQAIPQLHYDAGNPLWELDRRVMACTFCHVRDSGGAPWNPFGRALQAAFVTDARAGGKARFPDVLYTVLKAEGDADGDGYSDVLEVYARTLPGDPDSVPTLPLPALRAAFDAAGGAAQYVPPTQRR
ncbi:MULTISPECIES: hypothetical protein [Deinococcus]|uniref:Cytochrome c domain-containing protein n=1 Tax=Deinococcus rufus TaxID=2136097 RepID=A0ABV7ZAJ1_9DEIO|nr:hypothetical protein [Deinococcus sp. AB2017081]WQE95669.1 hypothetical protein U2P90_01955 [Deinococcus sp. AB2017081]